MPSQIVYAGDQTNKLFLNSGYTTTVITSQLISAVSGTPRSVAADGFNTPWTAGAEKKLVLQSGVFSSTVITSFITSGINNGPFAISWSPTPGDTPWGGAFAPQKLYLQSGQFSSVVKTSLDISGIVGGGDGPRGMSYDDRGHTPWCFSQGGADRLVLQSGQFSSTIITSIGWAALVSGISWDLGDTPIDDDAYAGGNPRLKLASGQFSTTLKQNVLISGIDVVPYGIDDQARPGAVTPSIPRPLIQVRSSRRVPGHARRVVRRNDGRADVAIGWPAEPALAPVTEPGWYRYPHRLSTWIVDEPERRRRGYEQ